MKNKIFPLFGILMIITITLVGLASSLEIVPSDNILSQQDSSLDLEISEATPGAEISFEVTSDYDDLEDIFENLEEIILDAGGEGTKNLEYEIPEGFEFEFGKEYSVKIIATDNNNSLEEDDDSSDEITLTFESTPFYEGENEGELEISDLDLRVLEGFGDDDNYWYPLDEVEIEFDVENKGDWDIENIEIKFYLWDDESEDYILDEDDVEIDNNDFDLDENDEITVKITFKIDPEELTEGNTDYSIYVSAEGTIDDSDAPDEIDGDKTGIDNEETIEIVTDDDFVIIDDIQIQPNPASCEGTIEITADVWNVGDEDLEDDEVYVWVYNKELEINKIIEFDSGIDAMDYEKIELSLEIPEELEEKTYAIRFVAYDDKDMDEKDIFETKDEDDASFYGTLEVSGNCNVKPQIDIKAELQSGGQAGKPLIVKSTLKNIGEESSSYEIILEGYEAWAELDEISSDVIILDKQESKDILITLDVNKDALGDKSFNIKIVSDGEVVIQQPVSVTIEKSGFSFPITGNIISEGNWYLWGIGALNVLLVVVIIIVAFKVARKK